jgi:hypothetical protein
VKEIILLCVGSLDSGRIHVAGPHEYGNKASGFT